METDPTKKRKKRDYRKDASPGHVNAEAIRRNIRLKYYWKSLENECKRFATKCGECQRFSRKGTFDHPAKAMEITNIFERIRIDVTEIYKNDKK